MTPPCLFLSLVTQRLWSHMLQRETTTLIFLALNCWNFLLFLLSLPGETKTTRRDAVSSETGGQDISWDVQEPGLTPCFGSNTWPSWSWLISFNTSLAGVWRAVDMLTTQRRHIFCAHIYHTQPWEIRPKGSLGAGGRLSWKPLGFNKSRFSDRKLFPFLE